MSQHQKQRVARTPKIEPVQPLAASPANRNAPDPPPPDGKELLRRYYWEQSWGHERARVWRARLLPAEQRALDAALEHERVHGSRPHPPAWYTQKPPLPLPA